MKPSYILAIDQGTTGSRAILYRSSDGRPKSSAYQEIKQYYPQPGWVEHDPEEIAHSVREVTDKAIRHARISRDQIAAIGITNQRETVVFWDRKTGKSLGRAIVWQDRRTSLICERLKKTAGLEPLIRKKTGLFFDPYFSGTKIRWYLENSGISKKRIRSGAVCCGTIDSWVLFQLTGGRSHLTNYSNTSHTLLFK